MLPSSHGLSDLARGVVLALAVGMTGNVVLACGACVEDKMAATYDHDVVQKAAADKRLMVFCDVKTAVQEEQLKTAARNVAGVDAASVRTSANPAALSFAIDPKVQSPEQAIARIKAALGPTAEIALIRSVAPK